MPRNEDEAAGILVDLYRKTFGGKQKGKYRFSRKALLVISNRRALREAFLDELKALLLERDFYLLDMRNTDAKSEFALVSVTFVNNLRPLPKSEYRNYHADRS